MTSKPITKNTLFYGDNLPILREHIPDDSIDLVYLDPPSTRIAPTMCCSETRAATLRTRN
jgi:hypothetical protein